MKWNEFVRMVMWRVDDVKKVGIGDKEVYLRELRMIGRLFNDEYLRVSWSDGKGRVMLGVCGEMWDWNWELERLERFRVKVGKELKWFM